MTEQPNIVREFSHPPPHDKTIELTLQWWWVPPFEWYEVKQITNTTWYKPGMKLDPNVVTKICDLPKWQVTMVTTDVLGAILGLKNNVAGLASVASAAL